MGWQDREYNAGREEMKAYFANPLGLMQYALPIYRSSQLHIRLSFWFLLTAIFIAIDEFRNGIPILIPIEIGLMLVVCLLHEMGHRVFAAWVRGNHWEWVLWPIGGLVAPTSPRTPKAVFVSNVGGIALNALVMAIVITACLSVGGHVALSANILTPIGLTVRGFTGNGWALAGLDWIMLQCSAMIIMNLFPCYWFDGGHLWQSVLWPFFGQWKAGLITVWAGMILAVPLFFMALFGLNPLMMVFWALIFADCFRRRQALAAVGENGLMEEEDSSYNYMDTPEPRVKRKHKKGWLKSARKRALKDQAEQAKIDAILAKVKDKGLHSLTWWEKRTLRKATERQRQHDLASRL